MASLASAPASEEAATASAAPSFPAVLMAALGRYHGVHWDERRGKWRAVIRLDHGRGEVIQLGVYSSEEQAMLVRDAYIRLKQLPGVRVNRPAG